MMNALRLFCLTVFMCLCTAPTDAKGLDVKTFGQIPILDEGRIKPIDSFARALRKEFSGTATNATAWLIRLMFDPARGENAPVIKLSNQEVLNLLQIDTRPSKLYSYTELFQALDQKQALVLSLANGDKEDWTPAQAELIRLQEKTVKLRKILSSFSALLPLDIEPPRSYIDMADDVETIQNWVATFAKHKGANLSEYTPQEQKMAELSFLLTALKDNGQQSDLFRVVSHGDEWLSPWEITLQNPEANTILDNWKTLALTYNSGNAQAWNDTVQTLHQKSVNARPHALGVEYYYNTYNPFLFSFVLCFLALCTLSVQHFSNKDLFTPASILLAASILIQIIGIAARVYILARPPVSTLYETILFVCALSMLYCLLHRKDFWLWVAAGLGVFLHILGFSHVDDGDTLLVLVPVLNTNFWLTTHVLTITAGYAFCALTSVLAHYLLVYDNETIRKNMMHCAIIALFFTTIGTVLGGIWADQSWGRFWGWDPKENGALLIVLWLIWILHGRISGMMQRIHVLYGLSYLSVILALSWFGVNLLSVGLHSYGFSDGAGLYLAAFTAIETSFLAFIYFRRRSLNFVS